ncbi:H(+)/Cl(-) exchange transporter 7 [Salpingoeca rosetta]|uniref:Chloride channel protein n=1 Tax=Salpingoeca rosetta (strain ATCC 50818 / BSB-021) TaxID=946362 RepID=F2UCD7_SALR5|nr:H(+)/Cl(-) exchange transporter 7 [Salpingoeca rosetta]EGD74244.1 H(+)/Cl(-) exchange transporter 7 [Salpingoeca rosetta]|eukprot:XP_004993144.1 H(+)/Cl(-) exchange transporter 7 [Salpingoeca rosetta]
MEGGVGTRRRATGFRSRSVDPEVDGSGVFGASETSPLLMRDRAPSMWGRLRNRFRSITAAEQQHPAEYVAPHRRHFARQMVYESLDYEITESRVEMKERRKLTLKDHFRDVILRWVILFFIGIFTAFAAFAIDVGIKIISKYKFGFIRDSISRCTKHDCLSQSFGIWVGLDILLVGLAGVMVCFIAPIAAGSGIPEVKCYLNGIKMPEVVRLKTLVTKAIGVMFAVSGGMTIGKEGPMIHSGAVVAAGLSQGKSTSIRWLDTRFLKQFRNDVEKRDFVSGGAAAGVSAAFGAPIGGVLFSLEEGASFWNQFLTWRIFFCSMTATFVLNILLSTFENGNPGALSNPGLINFGKFEDMPYNLSELPLFIIMGVIGGLLGAAFNSINEKLTHFRMHHVFTPHAKLLEVLAVTVLTTVIFFTLIFFSDDCLPLGQSPESSSPLQFFCEEHQYSAMGALLFNTPEDSIKNLFHGPKDAYTSSTLAFFAIAYWALACITYGLSIPSGLFVPCLLTGASWGRLVGNIMASIFPGATWVIPGKYALIGAAAMLAGVVRMTISLTVIIIEATGNVTYGLPIMLAVIFAKLVGDYFNEGLYDIHIELKHIPLLPWAPPPVASHRLQAQDFMSRDIQCVRMLNRVGDIYRLLRTSKHNAFPVIAWHEDATVETNGLAIVQGMVLRQHLIALLKHRGYGHKIGNMVAKNELALDELTQDYPRWPKISSVDVPKEDYDMWMDLRPYMNPSPYLVQASCSLAKIFRLFRTMGLRHLVVVNKMNELVGLVTRKDLANITNDMKREDFLHSRLSVRHVKYIMPENITDDVDAVLIRDREDHPRVEDLGQNGPDDSIMPMN